ncbi:hypothetical protein EVG20_g3567 [Dentipellis fragilis]|uniref:DNA mismatch repair proteins mutS family domain-containing protein n=1 Tax=Dentipellis fragilis TaxID=205917 RepID=A0A4Y9Z196_9AGAM|nr:hypothetical protein EVG20_g3567 [Dentipellis fragilis]
MCQKHVARPTASLLDVEGSRRVATTPRETEARSSQATTFSMASTRSSPSPANRKRKATEDTRVDTEDGTEDSTSGDGTHGKKVRWGGSLNEDLEDGNDDESTRAEKICMAASCSGGKMGCCYYDPVKCIIFILEDTQESIHFDTTKMLLEQTSPDVLLTSSNADDQFTDLCRDFADTTDGLFQIRPHKDFNPRKGLNRMLTLGFLSDLQDDDLGQEPVDSDSLSEARNAYEFMTRRKNDQGDPSLKRWNASVRMSNFASLDNAPLCVRTLRRKIASFIDNKGCIPQIGSMGALLDHLARVRAVGELEDYGVGGLDIRGIEALALDEVMQINADPLASLQIFENESHASIHSDKTKEGLSLFGILNNTRTALGRSLMRTWLLRPSLRIPVIAARHDAVACFTNGDNLIAARAMHNHLKGIKNVPKILSAMKSGKAGIIEWQGLFAFHTAMIRDALTELNMGHGVEIVQKLVAALDISSFKEAGAMVNEVIDWEESGSAGRICVRPHIDEELDNRKHIYHGIDTVLSKVAEDIAETVPPDYATSLNVVYFPQLGFLVCVPMLDEWKSDEGIRVLDGWTFQFSSEAHVYFKSDKMHDLDMHIGDLYPSIVDRELEIIQELQEKILAYEKAMGDACDICAELDCLLSFAEASNAYGYIRPEISEENIINIKAGRHPLQEQVVDTFVPNDTFLVGGAGLGAFPTVHSDDDRESLGGSSLGNSVLVCTGANACGKSVYLKQVAVIQIMAQIGCFVPAESATLGIVQSAFMIDLNQVSLALRNSTSRSLILLDEFGKGTLSTGSYKTMLCALLWHPDFDSDSALALTLPFQRWDSGTINACAADGAGLFCGVLKSLLNRGTNCPKVLATTHFHDVFRPNMLSPRTLPITFVHMEVMFTMEDGEVIMGDDNGDDNGDNDSTSTTERGTRPPRRQVLRGEKITYLYRVALGLSTHSHAARCAELYGIPAEIIERAQYVSQLLSDHDIPQLLDEEMTDNERRELVEAEEIGRRFLAWDLRAQMQPGQPDVKERLAEILGRLDEEIMDE